MTTIATTVRMPNIEQKRAFSPFDHALCRLPSRHASFDLTERIHAGRKSTPISLMYSRFINDIHGTSGRINFSFRRIVFEFNAQSGRAYARLVSKRVTPLSDLPPMSADRWRRVMTSFQIMPQMRAPGVVFVTSVVARWRFYQCISIISHRVCVI